MGSIGVMLKRKICLKFEEISFYRRFIYL
jgi:hypothetical protein